MECLHGVPAALLAHEKGKFFVCDNKNVNSCEFFCPEQDCDVFKTAIYLWKYNGAIHPVCHAHQQAAKMRVVKDITKQNYGRPYFVCCFRSDPCNFWQWGDQIEIPRPKCRHGLETRIHKVKKVGNNHGRLFYCCPNQREAIVWLL